MSNAAAEVELQVGSRCRPDAGISAGTTEPMTRAPLAAATNVDGQYPQETYQFPPKCVTGVWTRPGVG